MKQSKEYSFAITGIPRDDFVMVAEVMRSLGYDKEEGGRRRTLNLDIVVEQERWFKEEKVQLLVYHNGMFGYNFDDKQGWDYIVELEIEAYDYGVLIK